VGAKLARENDGTGNINVELINRHREQALLPQVNSVAAKWMLYRCNNNATNAGHPV